MTRKEKLEDYEGFVEKFKPKKTTDDCITPLEIYEIIKNYACNRWNIDPDTVVRPFWPGGNYENFDYSDGKVVIDNPPFSILAKICSFYLDRGIPFFLFAPSLTCLSGKKTATRTNHLICDCKIVYENGAVVPTSFITSYGLPTIIESCPDLTRAVNEKMEEIENKKRKNYNHTNTHQKY